MNKTAETRPQFRFNETPGLKRDDSGCLAPRFRVACGRFFFVA
ncbi:hypothetical protein [Leucothrix mucor]|nr:hypothetical protein [Leucothrix mucor]